MKIQTVLTGAALLAAPVALIPPATAQEILLAEAYQPRTGDEIVVTATRGPQALEKTLASTTVIDRQQIETSQARDLYQLLRGLAGVEVLRTGGRGAATGLSLRGGPVNGTLILVDGVNVESASLGQTALEQLSIDQIERIEIIRGPRSSLYGSSAMNGVVQIFTRKGAGEPGVKLSLGGGTDNTRDAAVSFNGATETSRFNVTAAHVASDGFDARHDEDNESGNRAWDRDEDGYRRSSLSLGLDQQLGDHFSADLMLNRNEGKGEYDNMPGFGQSLPYTTYDTLLTAAGLAFDNDLLHSRIQYAFYKDRNESDDDVLANSHSLIETRRTAGQWENSLSALDWLTLNFGTDYTHEEMHGTNAYSETRRDNFAGYANAQSRLGDASWSLGFRHDDNEQFGSKWTGDTALGYELARGVQASLSYGTAFKAPSFNDLYWPASSWASGNPDLLPEESETYEIGIDANRDWGMASVHVYKTWVENLIDWAYVPPLLMPSNVDQAKMRGVEIQYGTRWIGVDWKTAYTYEKATDADGEALDRRPRQKLALDMDKTMGDWSVGATLYGRNHMHEGTDRLGGHGQLDLRTAWMLSPEVKLRLRLDNLLDKDYEDAAGFNNEGRAFMFFVDYRPR